MANKKINQLVSKTSILGTDLFPLGDGTTGQLFKKTVAELQAAIGGAVISVNGLVGTVVLDTDDIQELPSPTNRYFTDARARGAISLTVSGASGASTYNSSTGVLNVPTYTLAGLGGITASFLSGGTGITYNSGTGVIAYSGTVYTDSSIRGLFSGGTGITYNSSTGAISYSGTVYTDSSIRGLFSGSTGISYNSTTGAISSTITQYTDALARASISLTTTGTSGASTYNSTTGVLNIPQYQAVLTNPITGTGTTNYVTKWTSSSAVGNSQIFDNGTNVGIGTTNVSRGGLSVEIASASATSSTLFLKQGGALPFAQINGADGSHGIVFVGSPTNGTPSDYSITRGDVMSFYEFGGEFRFYKKNGTLTEQMRITSAGNVGIGTTTPVSSLHVVGSITTTGSNYIRSVGTGSDSFGAGPNFGVNDNTPNNYWLWQLSGSGHLDLHNYNNAWSTKMRVTSAGNVGINNSNPDFGSFGVTEKILGISSVGERARLHFQNTSTGTSGISGTISAFNGATQLISIDFGAMGATNSGGIMVNTNNAGSFSERIRITSGGNMLIGTTTNNGEILYVAGNIRATGTITANSDISLKKNLAKIENALEKVEQISGYTYEFKADDSERKAGVIAQEIEKVLPEIVNKGADGILGVEYGNISALLIEAIKEQQTQINELKALLNK